MIDRYQRNINYLRISVTESCNLRCRYCMPEDGGCPKAASLLTDDEFIIAIEAAASIGITKLRFTGGEPLIRKNIVSLCQRAAEVGGIEEVCVTTNGILLPQLAEPLHKAGVTRLNISLDTLNSEKYSYITRVGTLDNAIRGIEKALECGYEKIKINAVLIGGFNDDEIRSLSELTLKWPVDMRFIEMMPMYDSGDFNASSFIPVTKVLEELPEAELLHANDGVAKLCRLPGAKGNIGLISPISSHFCAECCRLRLTADGMIKPCLHDTAEISVKGLDLDGMRRKFEEAINIKPRWRGELDTVNRSRAGRNMNQIGG